MSVLWFGGEDIDFPNGPAFTVSTNTSYFRTAFARCALRSASSTQLATALSIPFDGGAITSGWFSAQIAFVPHANVLYAGLALSGTSKGLAVGSDATGNKISLWKTDGTTATLLASESGNSWVGSSPQKIDMHIQNYGASATVTVYCNGVQVISYTGNVAVSGVTGLDCAAIWGGNGSVSYAGYVSECIVADEDTRLFSMRTLAPDAAGDANAWTGTYSDINEVTINDATEMYTNVLAQDAQVNVNDLPAGTFTVKAVKISARVAKSVGSTVGSIGLGVKSGGTIDPGTPQACDTAWATKERLMLQNPVTANIWQPSEINNLQLNFRSAT